MLKTLQWDNTVQYWTAWLHPGGQSALDYNKEEVLMKHTNKNSYLAGLSVKNKLRACNLLLMDYLLISADTNGL